MHLLQIKNPRRVVETTWVLFLVVSREKKKNNKGRKKLEKRALEEFKYYFSDLAFSSSVFTRQKMTLFSRKSKGKPKSKHRHALNKNLFFFLSTDTTQINFYSSLIWVERKFSWREDINHFKWIWSQKLSDKNSFFFIRF